jgi:hypothetical protein
MSGHAIFRENYKAKGWFFAIGSFMNRAGKFMNNLRGTGDLQVYPNPDGGLDFHFESRGGSGSVASSRHPFQVRDVSAKNEYAVSVRAGAINNLVSSSDKLTVAEWDGYVFAALTLIEDTGAIDAIELKIEAEIPEDTLTLAHIALAQLVTVDGQGDEEDQRLINPLVTHSLWHYRCGSSPDAFRHIFGAV